MPTLIPTGSNSGLYRETVDRYKRSWSNPNIHRPHVKNVFYVNHQGQQEWYNYDNYRKRIGNEKFMWHGTTRACNIGDDPTKLNACFLPNCSLCHILRHTFDPSMARSSGMLGFGAYVAPNSSKSYTYLKQTTNRSRNLVLLRCGVALGRTFTTGQPMQGARSAPPGYNSVYARKGYTTNGAGKTVSNDEYCVYTKDAILPVEIIILRDH